MSTTASALLVCGAVGLDGFCPVAQVGPSDSLNSIALKFNITPNKLVQLNKLFSRSVYPGQVRRSPPPPPAIIGVPASHRHYIFFFFFLHRSCLFLTVTSQSRTTRAPPSPMASQTARHTYVSRYPGGSGPFQVLTVSSDFPQDAGTNCKSIRREMSPNSEDESPATVKFIKMSCKYFTDGMVNGRRGHGARYRFGRRPL